jgi:IS4 transposase
MLITSPLSDQWPEVRSLLPSGFDIEATARSRGAFTRARGVKDAETLLRLALAYGGCGMSLRECCAWAAATGVATLSDPALLKRLGKASAWLGDLVAALLAEPSAAPGGRWAGYRLRAIDASSICAPGADRTTWRLHAAYDLATGQVDHLELTDVHGAESLSRFPFQPGEIEIADRGYARPRDLRPVLDAGADLIVRTGWNALSFSAADGAPFDLFAVLAGLSQDEGECSVAIRERKGEDPLPLRLVFRRKSPQEAREAQKRLVKDAKKRGKKPDPRSLEAARYILLLTSLPAETFPASDVLALYRLRWQIELAFKRFKSLAGLDRLPAKNPELARAWIHARLITILLAERIAGKLPDSSPSAPENDEGQPIAMAKHKDNPRKHQSRHSWMPPMEGRTQRRRNKTATLPH